MRTTKLFFMAALALMTAACSNDDNDFALQPQKAEGITITAQLAPKTKGVNTRAVSDGGNKITAEWGVNEHIAILYTIDETQYAADATITAVDVEGVATIEFTVESETPDNTVCTLVYPYAAAKEDKSGVKDAATLLAEQDGTLNENLDVRVGEGTIQITDPSLDVTEQPAAQFAIFKFTTKNADGSEELEVTSLTVTIGEQDYVITPASETSTLYAALPAISGQAVTFTAIGSDSKTYMASKASVTFLAGYYYQSVIKMGAPYLSAATTDDVGKLAGQDGKIYATQADAIDAGTTAVAKIVYVGSNTGNDTYKHGLALALSDEDPMDWDSAVTACSDKNTSAAVTGASWTLASKDQWNTMIDAADSDTALRDGFSSVGGTNMGSSGMESNYWSSTAVGTTDAYYYGFSATNNSAGWHFWAKDAKSTRVRACLVF